MHFPWKEERIGHNLQSLQMTLNFSTVYSASMLFEIAVINYLWQRTSKNTCALSPLKLVGYYLAHFFIFHSQWLKYNLSQHIFSDDKLCIEKKLFMSSVQPIILWERDTPEPCNAAEVCHNSPYQAHFTDMHAHVYNAYCIGRQWSVV